jgi:hypothetical protein
MTKIEFIKQLHKDVDEFNAYIDECNRKYPEAKVEDQGEPDWFEQFVMFAESKT